MQIHLALSGDKRRVFPKFSIEDFNSIGWDGFRAGFMIFTSRFDFFRISSTQDPLGGAKNLPPSVWSMGSQGAPDRPARPGASFH